MKINCLETFWYNFTQKTHIWIDYIQLFNKENALKVIELLA